MTMTAAELEAEVEGAGLMDLVHKYRGDEKVCTLT